MDVSEKTLLLQKPSDTLLTVTVANNTELCIDIDTIWGSQANSYLEFNASMVSKKMLQCIQQHPIHTAHTQTYVRTQSLFLFYFRC